jgi:hypothetical protein
MRMAVRVFVRLIATAAIVAFRASCACPVTIPPFCVPNHIKATWLPYPDVPAAAVLQPTTDTNAGDTLLTVVASPSSASVTPTPVLGNSLPGLEDLCWTLDPLRLAQHSCLFGPWSYTQSKTWHGYRVPDQLEVHNVDRCDSTIQVRSNIYVFGFHPLPCWNDRSRPQTTNTNFWKWIVRAQGSMRRGATYQARCLSRWRAP